MTLEKMLEDWARIWPNKRNMAEAYVAVLSILPDVHKGLKSPIEIQKYCNELTRHFGVYENQSLGCIKTALHLKELSGGRIQYDSNHAMVLAHGSYFDLMGKREGKFKFTKDSDYYYSTDNFLDESAYAKGYFKKILERNEDSNEDFTTTPDGDIVPEDGGSGDGSL